MPGVEPRAGHTTATTHAVYHAHQCLSYPLRQRNTPRLSYTHILPRLIACAAWLIIAIALVTGDAQAEGMEDDAEQRVREMLDLLPGQRPGDEQEPEGTDLPEELVTPLQPDVGGLAHDEIQLSRTVARLLDDPITSDAERRRLQVFHGQWDALDEDELEPADRAELALQRGELNDPIFDNDDVPVMLRARAAYERGEMERVLELIDATTNEQTRLLRARAMEAMGNIPGAIQTLRAEVAYEGSAPEHVARAQALVMRARLEGRGAEQWGQAMRLLAQARQVDPLYWPAYLSEAELLREKDNRQEAFEAIEQALSLNPRASGAWHVLGQITARGFNFDAANDAIDRLHAINPTHLLADLIEAHMRLVQRDPAAGSAIIAHALERYPEHRELLALDVAAAMLGLEHERAEQALARFEEVAPGHPRASHLAGMYLSLARQYDEAEDMLREAIRRQPNDTGPRIELGMLLMQAGKERDARQVLRVATQLDPFQRRANNTLRLVEDLLDYERIETEHFVITFREGIDEVVARDMARYVEDMYARQTERFAHEPERSTQIDLLQDREWFGVRVAGVPEIWAMGAATGPVIAMIPPRDGARQYGTYHWPTVLEHEFAHTVTLSRTRNRIPHWFTEGLAVWVEVLERDFNRSELLAWALAEGELFELDEINWGFIRPQTPRDRPLAYGQADWMVRFIEATWGRDALIDMMEQHVQGVSNEDAVRVVLEREPDEFMDAFRAWAREDVRSWGFGFGPVEGAAQQVISSGALDAEELRVLVMDEAWDTLDNERGMLLRDAHEQSHDHPQWLRWLAERAMESGEGAVARQAVQQYAHVRPADAWGHRELARLALDAGDLDQAAAALAQLDAREIQHGRWAHQLARIARGNDELDEAAEWMQRALYREPYNATFRELTATIALQRGDMDEALYQLETLVLLEPEREVHAQRLEALRGQMQ